MKRKYINDAQPKLYYLSIQYTWYLNGILEITPLHKAQYTVHNKNILCAQEVPRNAANARERTRMRVLSKAFGRLKLTLPWVPPDTKVGLIQRL